jgi:hypothetical protein
MYLAMRWGGPFGPWIWCGTEVTVLSVLSGFQPRLSPQGGKSQCIFSLFFTQVSFTPMVLRGVVFECLFECLFGSFLGVPFFLLGAWSVKVSGPCV